MSDPSSATVQICASCARKWDINSPAAVCATCGGLLEVIHPLAAHGAAELKAIFAERASGMLSQLGPHRSGVWRYQEIVLPEADTNVVTFPEGNTPLLVRDALAAWTGARQLMLKHEGQNPTGSFKDRGMSVAMTQAVRIGAESVACASTGNTSSSLAAYAGIASIPALVLVPLGQVSAGKLAQTIAYGARTLLVRGDFDDCLRLVREASERLGVYLVNSLNPFRIEGQKTVVLELLQQLNWRPPDWIVLPAGNLGNASAFGKAIREALALGLINRTPRLLLVQAEGAAPFARAFADNFHSRQRVVADTVATAIRIGDPASWDRAVRAVRETNGMVISVSDAEILAAKREIDMNGVGCEPASAATLAGVRALVQQGGIAPDESVVAVLTGHLLKDPMPSPADTRAETRAPLEVDATLAAVETVLSETT